MKKYNSLLELDAFDEEKRNDSLFGIFKRDFVESGNYFREKKVLPSLAESKEAMANLFEHLITIKNKPFQERVYDRYRAIRIHWIKYHLEEKLPGTLHVFSVKDKAAIRTYLYNEQESYVVILEPRGKDRYYLLTAYYLLGRNKYKIEKKMKRKLESVF